VGCAVYLYDAVKNQLSNLPVLDVYYNGAPLTKYENGAQVPPLLFPANSEIRVDIWSLVQDASALPITATFHFVGHRLIPS
jgi:hypothetical protein